MDMYRAWILARRYMRVQTKRKSFWFTVCLPIVSLLLFPFIMTSFKTTLPQSTVALFYDSELQESATLLAAALEQSNPNDLGRSVYAVRLHERSEEEFEAIKQQSLSEMRNGELNAFIELRSAESNAAPNCVLYTRALDSDARIVNVVQSAHLMLTYADGEKIKQAFDSSQTVGEGVYTDTSFRLEPIVAGPGNATDITLGFGALLVIVLCHMASRFGESLVTRPLFTSLQKEREGKIIETLLTAFASEDLVIGRMMGALVLGMGVITLYVAPIMILALIFGLLGPGYFICLWLFVATEIIFVGAVYFLIGSISGDNESAARATIPLEILWLVGTFSFFAALRSPDAPLTQLMCYLPITNAAAIPVRMALSEENFLVGYFLSFAMSCGLAAGMLWVVLCFVDKETLLYDKKVSLLQFARRVLRRAWRKPAQHIEKRVGQVPSSKQMSGTEAIIDASIVDTQG